MPKWQQRMLPTSVPEVVAQAIAFGTNLRTGFFSLKPLARFLRNQGGHYALEPPHSLLAGGHLIETYALRSNLMDVTTAPNLCELVAAGRYGFLGLDMCTHVDGKNVKFKVTNTEVDNRDPTESGRLTSTIGTNEVYNRVPTESGRLTSNITTTEVHNRDLNKLGRLTSNATNVEVQNRHSTELDLQRNTTRRPIQSCRISEG